MNVFNWRLWWRLCEDFADDIGIPWRLWKWRRWCDLEDMNEDNEAWRLLFLLFHFLLWVIGNTVLLKGAEVILRKISNWCSKASTYPILRVKPLEISCSLVKFFSDRDDDLLVSEEIGLTEELGFCQCELPTSEENDKPWGIWQFKFWPLLFFTPVVQIFYPPNGHIIGGHLCLIMSGCTLAINSRPHNH